MTDINVKETIKIYNPANQEVIGEVPNYGYDEAVKAVDYTFEAFESWSERSAYERSKYIENWYDLIIEHKDELAELVTKETGKPLSESLAEVDYAGGYVKWYAEETKRIYGDTLPASDPNKRIFVNKQPIGVVAAITTWNFPLSTITRKASPAFAAGCTIVIKPDKNAPLSAIRLYELAMEAGIPENVMHIVTGNATEIGEAWMKDSRVRKITFTGSTKVGKLLMRGSADTMKKLSLELGGNAPFIIMDDANVKAAVKHLINSKFRNAGQTCVCANRVFIHEDKKEEFLDVFVSEVKKLKVGNGLEEDTKIGPLINEAAIEKVERQIQDAIDNGAKILTGGRRLHGLFFEPTVIDGATDHMACMREETFGPLAPITTFKSDNEVIKRANQVEVGLAAYIVTKNIDRAVKMSEKLEYGIVGINDGKPSTPQAPFGGWKESGLGREGGYYGLDDYLEIKYISLGFDE